MKILIVLLLVLVFVLSTGVASQDTVPEGRPVWRTAWLSVGAMWPTTDAAADTPEIVEIGDTNNVDIYTADMDDGHEFQVGWALPEVYRNGTDVYATVYWTCTGAGEVTWKVKAQAYGEGDPMDASWGTAVSIVDTLTTASDMHISSESSAMTIANSPERGDYVQFNFECDAQATTLTYPLGIRIRFLGE